MQHDYVVRKCHHQTHVVLDDDHREVGAEELAEFLL
jgi:hypothetical protein